MGEKRIFMPAVTGVRIEGQTPSTTQPPGIDEDGRNTVEVPVALPKIENPTVEMQAVPTIDINITREVPTIASRTVPTVQTNVVAPHTPDETVTRGISGHTVEAPAVTAGLARRTIIEIARENIIALVRRARGIK